MLRGIVEVREGGVVTRLERGQRWSRQPEVDVATGAVTPPTAPLPPTGERIGERGIAPSVTELKQEHPRQRPTPTPTPATSAPEPTPEALPPAPPSTDPTPAETFALAMRARAAGHATEAIRSFQQVCERWPSSAYAPMSAFEWGRLALDTQADPRQAARAFERTLELATSASLIEDALARLAEAYARYDVGSCRRVQAEYLRRFPEGPHVRGVTKACPP